MCCLFLYIIGSSDQNKKEKKSIILNYSPSKQLPTVLMGDKIAYQSLKFECFFNLFINFQRKVDTCELRETGGRVRLSIS